MTDLTRRLRELAVGPWFYTMTEAIETIERLTAEVERLAAAGVELSRIVNLESSQNLRLGTLLREALEQTEAMDRLVSGDEYDAWRLNVKKELGE